MSTASGERWWYGLLRKIKRGLFSDSKVSALLSAWFRRVGYPRAVSIFYIPLGFDRKKVWLPLRAQAEWAASHNAEVYLIGGGCSSPVPMTFPSLYCSVIDGAHVLGSTNFILDNGSLLHHDLYAFDTDYTSEENYFRMVLARDLRHAVWMAPVNRVNTLEIAAVFTDGCAANYAHWLTEVLPRVAVFCADERFKDIPLVIDKGLHPNIMASLRLLAGDQRRIHEVGSGESIRVERLYWMSVAGYVPYERRESSSGKHAQGVFSQVALDLMRRVCLQAACHTEALSSGDAGPKIYLRRNSGVRQVRNGQDVERYLVGHGFRVVEPEKMTFAEQVRLFAEASMVLGPTGAAFANLIFARPGARIVVFMGEHPDAIYDYWGNIAQTVGLSVDCLRCASVDDGRGIHADFSVDLVALQEALGLYA